MKNLFSKKMISVYLGIAVLLSTLAISFAWFEGTIDKTGIAISVGKISVDANGYYMDSDGYLVKCTQGLDGTQQIATRVLSSKNEVADTYFIVERSADSIDVDYSIILSLETEDGEIINLNVDSDELQNVGGYWFQVEEITSTAKAQSYEGLANIDTLKYGNETEETSTNEKQLLAYINYQQTNSIANGGNKMVLSLISSNNISGKLYDDDNVDFYRLTYGFNYGTKEYTDFTIKIRASIYVAQKGSLTDDAQSSQIYTVSTLVDFTKVFNSYKPGDTIKITGSFTYSGDVVFTRPVNLIVQNATFKVVGNLTFSFPYNEEYYIDTQNNGTIQVCKASVGGGYLDFDTPNSKVQLIGKGKSNGTGDFYVQKEVTVNASYKDGIIFSGTNIYDTDSSGDIPTSSLTYKTIYFNDSTTIEVAVDTEIKTIENKMGSNTEQAPSLVKIINNGTIDKITLTSMRLDTSYTNFPQIFIDNFGTYGTSDTNGNCIYLPVWSSKYTTDSDGLYVSGNTRIIQEKTSNELDVSCANGENTDRFEKSDIEVKNPVAVEITGNDTDGYDVIIYYYGTATSIKEILLDYYDEDLTFEYANATSATTSTSGTLKDTYLVHYNSLTITTLGDKSLSEEDYALIRGCTSLVTLDLSNASDSDKIIEQYCFNNMSQLENLSLPSNITTVNGSFLRNTKVEEIVIPSSVTKVVSNAFSSNVKYVHLKNTSTTVYSGNSSSMPFLFVDESMLENYRTKGYYASYKYKVFPESQRDKTNKRFYRYLREENYYELVFQYGDLEVNSQSNYIVADIEKSDGTVVDISSISDYCFYNYEFQSNCSIYFDDSVIKIGNYAFHDASFVNVNLNKVEIIGDYAFDGLSVSGTFNANQVTEIGNYAFNNISGLVGLEFPNLESIGEYAFRGGEVVWFKALKVSTVGHYAFSNMQYLELIYLPNFYQYPKEKSVTYPVVIANNPKLSQVYLGTLSSCKTGAIDLSASQNDCFVYICGTTSNANNAAGIVKLPTSYNSTLFIANAVSSMFTNTSSSWYTSGKLIDTGEIDPNDLVPANTYKIDSTYELNVPEYVLYLNEDKAEIVCYTGNAISGETFNVLGEYTYKAEDSVITIPSFDTSITYTIVSIGSHAFSGVDISVTNMVINDNITKIEDYTFADVTINNFTASNVTSLGDYTFSGSIITGTIDMANLETMGDGTFSGTSITQNITFSKLKTAGNYCFNGVTDIKEISAPSLTSIGYQFINNIESLHSVYLPALVEYKNTTSSLFAISKCANLAELYIGPIYSGNTYFISNIGSPYIYICGTTLTLSGKMSTKYGVNASYWPTNSVYIINSSLYSKMSSSNYNFLKGFSDLSAVTKLVKCSCDANDLLKYGNYDFNDQVSYNVGDYIVEPETGGKGKIIAYNRSIVSSKLDLVTSMTGCFNKKSSNVTIEIDKIGENAFSRTTFTQTSGTFVLSITGTLDEIGSSAFANLSNANIYLKQNTQISPASTNAFGSGNTLYVETSIYLSYYKDLESWNGIENIYPGLVYEDNGVTYFYETQSSYQKINYVVATLSGDDTSLTIPSEIDDKNVVIIGAYAFAGVTGVTSITLPSYLRQFETNNNSEFIPETLTSYSIDENNYYYSATDGVLYNKTQTTLISYPKGKTDTSFTVPNTVQAIFTRAFADNAYLESITINSAVYISSYAFANMKNGLAIEFTKVITSTSDISYFVGEKIFDGVDTYTITFPAGYKVDYLSGICLDESIKDHIA